MLASSFGDPVLGVDIHWELVPTPAGPIPTPIPNPFTGIVFDPLGLAAGLVVSNAIGAVLGAPMQGPVVYWGVIPATNTGTEAKHIPGHIIIPPGTSWAPVPKTPKPVIHPGETPSPPNPVKPEDDAISVFGSKTVSVMGSNAVRLGDMWLSCSEPVRLPSSVVLPVPKGAPILIGGPPSLDLMAAVMASLRTRFVSDSLHSLISRMKPSRLRSVLHWVACKLTGHPVDVASGRMLTNFVDAELPGPLPLKIERNYSSAFANRKSPLGYGWSYSLDQAVWRERGKVVYLAEDGREIEFDTFDFPDHTIQPGQEIWHPIDRLTLRCKKGNSWEIETHEGLIHYFAPLEGQDNGRAMIQRIRSRDGFHEISFFYNEAGLLDSVRDSAGRLIHVEYDNHGRLVVLKLPHPTGHGSYIHRQYEYSQEGDLVRVTDPLDGFWTFEYVTHLITRETDRNGLSFYFAYDGFGEDAWCVRTWGDNGIYDHVISYDKQNHVTYVKNSLGHTTTYHMNVAGLVVKVVDPLGGETQYEYDPQTFQQTCETDPLGNITSNEYDERGNNVKITGPDGAVLSVKYDKLGNPIEAIDAIDGKWSWEYETSGRLIKRINPLGETTTYQYSGKWLSGITDPMGGHTSLGYDSQGNLTRLRTADEAENSWDYDQLGRVIVAIDPKGNRQLRLLDLLGRVVKVQEPDGNLRRLQYDPEGNVVHAKDNQYDVKFAYSGMGRIRSRSEAGTTVQFAYDSEEKLIGIKNEHDYVYRFELDENGEVAVESGFDDVRRVYTRDVAGRVSSVQRASGLITTYQYDPVGRVTTVEHSDGSTESYQYRLDGELEEATNDTTTIRFERDALGRVLKEWQGYDYWVASEYNPLGLRIRMSSSLGAVQTIERNIMGDVTQLSYASGEAKPNSYNTIHKDWQAHFKRDLMGLELERQLPGGIRSRWERDRLGRPLQHQIHNGYNTLRDVRYSWDVNDRLHQVIDVQKGITKYGHDALGNLAAAQYGDGVIEFRMPDAVGNLFRTSDRSDRKYGPAGQLLESYSPEGTTYYTYDAEGNLITKQEPDGGEWRYFWNAAGMLEEVVRPDQEVVHFTYDVLARRTRKEFQSKVTRWVWDGNNPLHEWVEIIPVIKESKQTIKPLDSDPLIRQQEFYIGHPPTGPPPTNASNCQDKIVSNNLVKTPEDLITWLFEPESFAPIAKIENDKRYSIVTDYLGTPVAMVDQSGRNVWSADISVYGELINLMGKEEDCPFRWLGQYEDKETKLRYNRFRYFDSKIGNYLSQDPLRLAASNRLYTYVKDTTSWIDPFGLLPWGDFMNSAEATISAGGVSQTYPNIPGGQHAEINGLTDFERRGLLSGNDVTISNVNGDFNPGGTRPAGICTNCRTDMFDILQRSGATSVTMPVTIGNQVQGSITIRSENFERVARELREIRAGAGSFRTKSDAAWDVLRRHSTSCQ